MVAFNGSKFHLTDMYKEVFGFLHKDGEEKNKMDKDTKFYKIKYSLNLLPRSTYVNGKCERISDLLDGLGDTSESSVFET